MEKKKKIEWYLPDPQGVASLGPFLTEDIAQLIISGKLRTDDFICAPSIFGEKWERIFRFDDFMQFLPKLPICPPPKLFSKGIYADHSDVALAPTEGFKQNKVITKISADIILHNNLQAADGRLVKLSVESITVLIPSFSSVAKGQVYYLTICNCPDLPTFTCQAVVMDVLIENAATTLSLYFIRLNPDSKKIIAGLVHEQSSFSRDEVV